MIAASTARASQRIDTEIEVDTPEHLAFRARVAGPGRRMFAWTLDFIVRGLLIGGIGVLASIVFGSQEVQGMGQGLIMVTMFVLDWGYFFVSETTTGGRSPGKMVLKLRVVKPDGLPITWRESLLRNLLRAADLAFFPPYFIAIGPMVMAMDSRFRRLGDLVAGTMVVVEAQSHIKRTPKVTGDTELVRALPRNLPLDENDLEAIELFVSRQQISRARREELAAIVAPLYAERLRLPEPKNGTRFLTSLWVRAQEPQQGGLAP